MPDCFVIMPLTTPPDSASRYGNDRDHFAHVLDHLFVPAIEKAGFTARKPIADGADLIHEKIVRDLETAHLVLCDISALNANVFFEFGIRTALNRPICLVRDEHTPLPFDVSGINCHEYASGMTAWETPAEIKRLALHIRKSAERKDNALWRRFGLTQRAEAAIEAAPEDMATILTEFWEMQPSPTWDEVLEVLDGLDCDLVRVEGAVIEVQLMGESTPATRLDAKRRAASRGWDLRFPD